MEIIHDCNPKDGWRCIGNGPIWLEFEYYSVERTEVNYCPFCGFSELPIK